MPNFNEIVYVHKIKDLIKLKNTNTNLYIY